MTTIVITGVPETKAGMRKLKRALSKTNPLFNRIGRSLRDDARKRITTQDNGAYDKLSKWTRARTGRRKALITERKNISFQMIGSRLIIGHTATGWDITMHERGFVTPGFTGKTVTIPLKNPTALRNIQGNSITIRGAKPSVVPARRVFSTESEALAIIENEAEAWVRKIVQRVRR